LRVSFVAAKRPERLRARPFRKVALQQEGNVLGRNILLREKIEESLLCLEVRWKSSKSGRP